jgi:hypothetical protein
MTSLKPEKRDALIRFARWALSEGPFDGCGLDGDDIQRKAEELGIIKKVAYDPKVHGPSNCDAVKGDDWFVFDIPEPPKP